MGARRPPGGAEPQRRRRGEWRRLRRCSVLNSRSRAPGCWPSARGGGSVARAQGGGRRGPGTAPPLATGFRSQEATAASGPSPGGAVPPPQPASPGSPSWWRKPPASTRTAPAVLSLPPGERARAPRRGPHPLLGPVHCAPEAWPRSRPPAKRALAVRVTCCGAARSPSRRPVSDPERLVLRSPRAGRTAGPGALLRSGCCTTRSRRIERRFGRL